MTSSCCLIGEDSLLIQCANILLNKKHKILVIVTTVTELIRWAERHHIPCMGSLEELLEYKPEPDYIFSIVNGKILTTEILQLAKRSVFNYHDSPLPKYAGLHATTWAILNSEKQHAVTWHLVTETIDQGDIAAQRFLPIYDNDTAFSLNLRCYEEAILAFQSLIESIDNSNIKLRKQDLSQYSYFGKKHLLENLGFIDWRIHDARWIERMSRALDFGNYKNSVGSLKLACSTGFYLIDKIEVVPLNVQGLPGELISIEDNALVVATINEAIKLKTINSQDGCTINPKQLIKEEGRCFQSLDKTLIDEHKSLCEEALKQEDYWLQKLEKISEHATFVPACMGQNGFEKLESVCLIPGQDKEAVYLTLTTIILYLYRLNEFETTTIQLYKKTTSTIPGLLSEYVPFHVDCQIEDTIFDLSSKIEQKLADIEGRGNFLQDISARYPSLRQKAGKLKVAVNLSGKTVPTLPLDAVLYFELISNQIHVYHQIDRDFQQGLLSSLLDNMVSHLANIIDIVKQDSKAQIAKICFLGKDEKNQLLSSFGKGKDYPLSSSSITNLFEMRVSRAPDQIAIYTEEGAVSYMQLWLMADKIADSLIKHGVLSGTPIGIYINRSVEMLAIILAVLKAGCSYVPLDVGYPIDKIRMIVEDANLSCILSSSQFLGTLRAYFNNNISVQLLNCREILGDVRDILNQSNDSDKAFYFHQEPNNRIEDTLYIMYTSGTTGRPKGVVVSQKNVLNYCSWFLASTEFVPGSIIDFSSSFAFDLSVPCSIAPLIAGGSIALCPELVKISPERYLDYVVRYQVSHAELTPGYLEQLLNHPDLVEKWTSLAFLLLGADVVLGNDVLKWQKLCPYTKIINEYGPTEATVSATSYFIDREKSAEFPVIPIGRPAFNTSCYVVDRQGNLCPIGVKGELLISGAQVTKGYLGRNDLTQEKFIQDKYHFSAGLVYKTGDSACWLPDGNLQFFGRNDSQVKIHGYRVELNGIESILLKIPEIQQAVVVVKQGAAEEKYLLAYLVCGKEYPQLNLIKDFLSTHLPAYSIPKEFCIVDHIPLRSNEKIDFEGLENMAKNFLTFKHEFGDGLSDYEKAILGIWQVGFNDITITVEDDFFEMGGNSLLALEIITKLKQHFEIDLPLSTLFNYPSVKQLSGRLLQLIALNKVPILKKSKKAASNVIKLSQQEANTAIFLVHPVGGSVFWYKQLAMYLEGSVSVYGIQDISIDTPDFRFESLEEMAAQYIQDIDTVWHGEEYYLGGASYGSTVAFEMANQLLKAKKTVGLLALLDGWARYPEELMNQSSLGLLNYQENEMLGSDVTKMQLYELEIYRKALLQKYQIPKINLAVDLFKAKDLWASFADIDDGKNLWGPYVNGEFNVHLVPGNHETMFFEPNNKILARCLSERLSAILY